MIETYHTLPIIIFLGAVFAFTFWSQRNGRMTVALHRKIWNIILTISFLASAVAGIMLAVIIDNNLAITWYRLLLWIHVETGLIMAVSGVFHALWHISYYKTLIKIKASML